MTTASLPIENLNMALTKYVFIFFFIVVDFLFFIHCTASARVAVVNNHEKLLRKQKKTLVCCYRHLFAFLFLFLLPFSFLLLLLLFVFCWCCRLVMVLLVLFLLWPSFAIFAECTHFRFLLSFELDFKHIFLENIQRSWWSKSKPLKRWVKWKKKKKKWSTQCTKDRSKIGIK